MFRGIPIYLVGREVKIHNASSQHHRGSVVASHHYLIPKKVRGKPVYIDHCLCL